MNNKPIKSILFIDIPEINELINNPGEPILAPKWKAENLITGPLYSRHMDGIKFSRGLLTMSSYLRQKNKEPHYVSINDLSENQLKKKIQSAEAVGILANVTGFMCYVFKTAQLVKKINPEIPVIVGGSHVTYKDRETLKNHPEIDIVVRGEGEKIINNLMEKMDNLNQVKGITYSQNGKIIKTPPETPLPAKDIPIPAYDLLPRPLREYSFRIQASRGCPYHCSFCIDHKFWPGLRLIPINKVITELKYLDRNLNQKHHIHFIDSNLTVNSQYTKNLCREISKHNFNFQFSGDIRGGLIDKQLIKVMEKAGFKTLLIGVEDPDQKVLNTIKKENTFTKNIESAKLIKKHSNILTIAYWIIGLPGSTHPSLHKAINQTSSLLEKEIFDLIYGALLVPLPGTSIFKNPSKFGLKLLTKKWNKYMRCNFNPVYELDNLSKEELTNYYLLFETTLLLKYCQKLELDIPEIISR